MSEPTLHEIADQGPQTTDTLVALAVIDLDNPTAWRRITEWVNQHADWLWATQPERVRSIWLARRRLRRQRAKVSKMGG
jgi:hypothetical protein